MLDANLKKFPQKAEKTFFNHSSCPDGKIFYNEKTNYPILHRYYI
tara:strand:- start:429 stop:563 length:135 start_codon:yes stop_codon:yes gene_type:complete